MKNIKGILKTIYYSLIFIKDYWKFYHTYWLRPKKSDDISNVEPDNSSDVVIVMQGPVKKEDNFTVETLKLYRKLYPQTSIIVSVWDNENENIIKIIESMGCLVITSKFPEVITGFNTTELQRITSIKGIQEAIKLNPKYILKTRTDQRMYENKVFDYLKRILRTFPLTLRCEAKERLVVCSMCTFSDRLYNLSDMFTFGRSEDVLRYYSCPPDLSKRNSYEIPADQKEFSKYRPGEIYFASYYIESLGFNLKWTTEDSNYYIKQLFVIVDNEMLDLFWPKYTKREYRWRKYTNEELKQVTFKEWLLMQ